MRETTINFQLIKNFKRSFLLIIGISFVGKILILSEFFFLRKAFNILEERNNGGYGDFVLFFLLSFASRAISLISSCAFAVALWDWILKGNRYFGSQIFMKLSKTKLSYLKALDKEGKIFSTINNDLNNYVSNKVQLISFYIMNIGTFLVTSIYLIYNNWLFGLIVIVSFLILQLTPKNFKRRMESINTQQSFADKEYVSSFSEALNNHLPLRLMDSAKLLKNAVFNSSKEEIKSQYLKDRFTTLVKNISTLLFFSAQRIIILAAILLYSVGYFQGFLKLGDVLSLPYVLRTLIHSLSFVITAKLHQESANNYLKILENQVNDIEKNRIKNSVLPQIKNIEKMGELSSSTSSITISNLGFSYTDKEIFKNLSLRFNPGMIYGIQGVSGIGKSTLISLILGKHNNFKGSIKIGEKEVRELEEENIYDLVKLVDSSNFVFDTTIEENVTIFDESLDPLPALKNAALLEEFESLSQQKVEAPSLSEGQKQRVNLARLFQHISDAKILILDEALSNLDQISREKVKESFRKLKDQGYTLIFVSHHIDKEDPFYDQLINLEDEVKKTRRSLED